jgi:hypothetical protein
LLLLNLFGNQAEKIVITEPSWETGRTNFLLLNPIEKPTETTVIIEPNWETKRKKPYY